LVVVDRGGVVVQVPPSLNSESSLSSGGGDKSSSFSTGKQNTGGHNDKKDPVVKLTSEGMLRRKGKCRNCGIYGHWKQDYMRPRKDCREEAHHVQTDVDQPSLLLTTVNAMHVEKTWCDMKPAETGMTMMSGCLILEPVII
jgi:hypothetical protein